MENFVTFPFDPNLTQTGISERKSPEERIRRLPEFFRQAAQSFFALFCEKSYSLFNAVQILIYSLRSLSYAEPCRYLLDGNEKHLSIRAFSPKMARTAYERQKGICPKCGKHFEIEEMQADHITPWSKGGKTIPENCQMLCKKCNNEKSNH